MKACKAQKKRGIPDDQLLGYLEGAALALDFLNRPDHDLGAGPESLPHGRVKPQNLLLVGDDVQVSDYGWTRLFGEALHPGTELARSYAYTAPEVFKEKRVSATTDQYTLAIAYHELLTGSLPFDYLNPQRVMQAHLKSGLNFAGLSTKQQQVLRQATALEPQQW